MKRREEKSKKQYPYMSTFITHKKECQFTSTFSVDLFDEKTTAVPANSELTMKACVVVSGITYKEMRNIR